jgi:hypothetical protein
MLVTDLEKADFRNDFVAEGQQQFNRPTDQYLVESYLPSSASYEPAAIQQGSKHKIRGIPIVVNRYLSTPGKDIEDLMCAAITLICRVCRSVFQLPVVASYISVQ